MRDVSRKSFRRLWKNKSNIKSEELSKIPKKKVRRHEKSNKFILNVLQSNLEIKKKNWFFKRSFDKTYDHIVKFIAFF